MKEKVKKKESKIQVGRKHIKPIPIRKKAKRISTAVDFELLLKAVPGLYLILDGDFKIMEASDAYLRATMTKREAILDRNLFEVFPDNPDDYKADGVLNLRASLNYVLQHKQPHTMAVQKYDIRKPDGVFEVRYWSPLNTPVLNAQNEVVYIIHNVTDITTRQTAEEKLKRSEKDYHLLVNSVKDYAIFMVDANGCVASWNSGAQNIKGYTPTEIIGKPIDVFYTEEERHRGEPKRNLQMALQHGHFETEGWRLRKDGSQFYANIVFNSLLDEEGKHYGYAKVTRDITEKRKGEEHIRFLASIAENIQDPIIAADNNFCTTSWNEAAEKLLEWKKEEVIGKPTREVLGIIYPENTRERILQSFNEKGYWQGDVTYHTKSGKPLNILATSSQLKDANGNITGILVLAKDITERKKIEKQLEEFEHFFNNNHDLCGIANTVGYFETINTNFSKVLGYSENEFCETSFIELIHPDDVASTLHEYEKLKAGELTINFVNRYRKKDGNYIHLDWNATPNPSTGKLYCVARDMTERKKAEDALNKLNAELEQRVKERTEEVIKNEKRFRALIENNHDIISLMDEKFKVFYRSPSAARITGWTNEDLINADGTKNIHPDDLEKVKGIIQEIMANPGKAVNASFRNQHKAGHYLWIEGTVINLLHDKDVKAIVFNFRDVTAEIHAEEKLVKERTLLRTLIDNLPDYIYVKDTQSRHLINNKANVELLGASTEAETIGKSVGDLLGSESTRTFHEDDQLVFRSGTPIINREETLLSPTGEIKYLLTTKMPLRDEGNSIVGLVGISRDITWQKRAEEKLAASEERFRSIIEQYPSPVIRYSPDGTYINANPAWETMWEDKRENVTGYNIRKDPQMIASGLSKYTERAFAGEVASTEIFLYDPSLIGKKGRKRWIQMLMYPLKDSEGKILEVILITLDMTDNKEAEEKLDKSEKLFRAMIEKDADMKTLATADGKVFYGSPSLTKVLDYEPEEYMTTPALELIHPDDLPGLMKGIQEIIQSPGKSFFREQRLKHKNGNWVWCEGTITNMLHDPAVNALVSNFRDISARKEAEEAILRAEANYREIFDKASDAIYVHELETGKVIEVNNRASEITGFTKEELISTDPHEFITDHPDYTFQQAANYLQQAAEGKPQRFEWLGKHKNGSDIWFEVSLKKANIAGKERILAFFREIGDRKKAEQKLLESEAFNQSVINSLSAHVAVMDATGKIVAVNEAWHRFALENGETTLERTGVGSNYYAVCEKSSRAGDDSATVALNGIIDVMNRKRPLFEFEYPCHSRTQQRWFSMRVTNFSKDQPMVVITHQDVTQRKETEDKIKESEDRFRSLYENSGEGILLTKTDGTILSANPAACKLFGRSEAEICAAGRRGLVDQNDPRIAKGLEERRKTGRMHAEWNFIRKDGTIFPCDNTSTVFTNAQGEERASVFIRDISERKNAEEKLVKSEVQYRRLFEASKDGILILNADTGVIEDVNPFLIDMLGYSHLEFLGKHLWEIGLFKDIVANQNSFLELQQHRYVRYENLPLKAKPGQIIWVEFISNAYDVGGKQIMQCNIRDISTRKLAEDEIKSLAQSLERKVEERTSQWQKVNKELEAFSYSVSHDLRAPLRSIDGYAHILEEDYADKLDEEGKKVIATITRNATRMGQLIDDMLAFSKYGRIEMSLATISMKEVVENILFEQVANETDRVIRTEVSNLHNSKGDLDMLRQVWVNYISNALKYSRKEKETRISIASYVTDDEVCYSIKDNGAGFDNQYAPKLFGVFQRLHKQNEFEGTGVGLATCKRIIDRHGGRVWAEGEPGKGATFYFSLSKHSKHGN